MTIAEQLENRGYQKGVHVGIEQGMQQGIEKGEHEKAIAIAKNLLTQGVPLEIVKSATTLSDADIAKLVKAH